MPQKISLAEILKNNPRVDPDKLKEGLRLAEELRKRAGVRPKIHPLIRRRMRIVDDLSSDPRLTQLSSLRQK